ncbi:MAG: surface antigen [Candidatus Saccharibacteria bacterium]|nr:surface antigen [Candidatus Saccharibacteria bacterium]
MKTVSRILKFVGSTGLVVSLVVVSSVPTHAVTNTNLLATCNRISSLSDTSDVAIKTKVTSMNADFTTRLTNIADRTTTIDPKVDEARAKATAAFDAKVTALQEKTGLTAIQKAAIKTYAVNMNAAEKTRETAVDAARTTYRTALTSVVTTHQTSLTNATTTYQTSVTNAFATATAHCADSTAISNLKTSVKAARDIFKSTRTDAKVTTDIKALMATRDAAIKAADANFTKATATYTATLSAVLDTTSSTTNAK